MREEAPIKKPVSKGPGLEHGFEEILHHVFFEMGGAGHAIADARTLRFLRVNTAFCEMTGYAAADFNHLSAWDMLQSEDAVRGKAGWERFLQGRSTSHRAETQFVRKDGSLVWGSVTTTLVPDTEGKPLYVLLVVQDLSARRHAMKNLREERRFLEHALFEVTEREQRRIGQELHDGLCQQMLGTAFAAKAMSGDLERRDPTLAARLDELAGQINQSVVHVRDVSKGLHPVELDCEGLMSALRELVQRTNPSCSCEFICDEDVLVQNSTTALHAYRIAQEAILNALKVTGARRIVVTLGQDEDSICLRVVDDGKIAGDLTADPACIKAKTLQYRARAMGGTLTMGFASGQGTEVTITFPKKHELQKQP